MKQIEVLDYRLALRKYIIKKYLGNFASVQQESILYELCLRFLIESLEQRQVGECLEGRLMYEYIVLRQAVLDLRLYRNVNCDYFCDFRHQNSPLFWTVCFFLRMLLKYNKLE
jgi:hypothetical protein